MFYNKSTPLSAHTYSSAQLESDNSSPSIRLKCGNLRVLFFTFSLIFGLFSLGFLCMMAAHSINPVLAKQASAISDFFGTHVAAFMTGPAIIFATLLYFAYSRKTLVCYNDEILIDDKPVKVVSYQIKRLTTNINFLYLQSAGRLWIIYPVTSQDGRKFPNAAIMQREAAVNVKQVKLLEEKLAASDAVKKRFWFFTKDVIISFIVYILITITALADI